MSRRQFIRNGALTAGALALAGCSSDKPEAVEARDEATAAPKVEWRLATSWPANIKLLQNAAARLAEHMAAMTNGRFTIAIDPASKTKAPLGVFDFVREGQYQMGHSASYYWKGKDAATQPFTTMPFGLNAQEQAAWFWYGGGVELMNEVYAKHGLLSYPGGNTGVQMGGWFRREIRSLADLRGLKMRIPGLAGEILARVGVNPVNVPPGELYTALERNVIDALEWINPYLDESMGFQQIAKYYYTVWHEPTGESQFLLNKSAFEALPVNYQSMLLVAMKECSFDMLCESVYHNALTWSEFQAQHPDVHVGALPDDVMAELRRQTELVNAEIASENAEFAAVLDSQEQFLAAAKEWTAISEQNYLDLREA